VRCTEPWVCEQPPMGTSCGDEHVVGGQGIMVQ
jgi:hypothetical protein